MESLTFGKFLFDLISFPLVRSLDIGGATNRIFCLLHRRLESEGGEEEIKKQFKGMTILSDEDERVAKATYLMVKASIGEELGCQQELMSGLQVGLGG